VSGGGQLEVLDIDGRRILKWILYILHNDGYWIDLALCRDRWCAFVNAVKNICVSTMDFPVFALLMSCHGSAWPLPKSPRKHGR
jgi:hypothetical protein